LLLVFGTLLKQHNTDIHHTTGIIMIGFVVVFAVTVVTSLTLVVAAIADVSYSQNATMTIRNFCSNQSSAGSGDYQANVGCMRNPEPDVQPLEYLAWCSVINGIVVANVTLFGEGAYSNCTLTGFGATDYHYNAAAGQCAVSYVSDIPIYNATVACVAAAAAAAPGQNNATLSYNLGCLLLCVIVAILSLSCPF
jgi:hypothetical protein